MKPTVSVVVITLIASLGAAADLVIEDHPWDSASIESQPPDRVISRWFFPSSSL